MNVGDLKRKKGPGLIEVWYESMPAFTGSCRSVLSSQNEYFIVLDPVPTPVHEFINVFSSAGEGFVFACRLEDL